MAAATRVSVLLVLALSSRVAWAQAGSLNPEALFELIAPSVWLVQAREDEDKGSIGSAVVIAPQTMITNCHVVEKARMLRVHADGKSLVAYLQYADLLRDLCQLNVPGLQAPAVSIGDPHALRVGAKLYAIGNPRGLELTLSDGLLSGLRRNAKGELQALQISAPISPGSSGGGLFNVYGQLVGITTFALKESQNLNFALPSHWIIDVPTRAGGEASTLVVQAPPKAPSPVVAAPVAAPVVAAPPVAASPVVPLLVVPPPVIAAARPAPLQDHRPPDPVPPLSQPDPVAASVRRDPLRPGSPPSPPSPPVLSATSERAALAPAAVPLPPSPPPRAHRTIPLAIGTRLEYRLTDRIAHASRSVVYAVDGLEPGRVVFNGGGRIENDAGEVVRLVAPVAGEADDVMPPGGWVPATAQVGAQWELSYRTTAPQQTSSMQLHAVVLGEETLQLAGRSIHALRVEFTGYTDRAITQPANASGRYRAVAWYSPDLARVVRFDVQSRGGLMSSSFVIDELLELTSIRNAP
jgi:hypothetical protein